MFEQLRQFFRDNPRLQLIAAVAGLTGLLVVWGVWGGFSVDVSQFFAAELTPTPTPASPVMPMLTPTPAAAALPSTIPASTPPPASLGSFVGGGACPTIPDSESSGPLCQPGITNNCTPYCGQCPLGEIIGSPAYQLRKGDLDLDPVSGLLFNWRPGICDYTQWFWNAAPSSPAEWCDPDFVLQRTAPPSQAPVFPGATTTRCFNGSSGGLDYSAFPACGPAVCGPGETIPPTPLATPPPTQTPLPTTVPPPTPTPEPTETPTPTAAVGAFCTPETQSVFVGQVGFFQASGGDGVHYQWNGGPGAIQEDDEGFSGSAAFSWTAAGTKLVTVNSAGATASCVVTVLRTDATTDELTGPIVLTKHVMNITVGQTAPRESTSISEGQRVEFTLRITDREGDGSGEVFVQDSLPVGMSYIAGSTTLDGQPANDGIVLGRISLGILLPGDDRTVRWSAVADRVGELPSDSQTVRPMAIVETSEEGESFTQSAGVTLTIFGTGVSSGGPLGGAGAVATGPGEVTLLALVLASTCSLLYAAHTRSPGFRKRELHRLGNQQGPMDFRN